MLLDGLERMGSSVAPPSPLMDAGPVNRGLCWNRFCLLLQIAAAAVLFKGWKASLKRYKRSVLVQEATENSERIKSLRTPLQFGPYGEKIQL